MELEFECKFRTGCVKSRAISKRNCDIFRCIENGKVCEYLEAKKGD